MVTIDKFDARRSLCGIVLYEFLPRGFVTEPHAYNAGLTFGRRRGGA